MLIQVGLFFLVFSNVWMRFAHPGPRLSAGVVDGVSGFLYGLTITTLLLGVWLKGRERSSGPGCP